MIFNNDKLHNKLIVDKNYDYYKEKDMFIFIDDEKDVLESKKINDEMLSKVEFENGFAFDFDNEILVSGQEQSFNEQSYYEMLEKKSLSNNEFIVSEQDSSFNEDSYLFSIQQGDANKVSNKNDIIFDFSTNIDSNFDDEIINFNYDIIDDSTSSQPIKLSKNVSTSNIDYSEFVFEQPSFEEYYEMSESDIFQQNFNDSFIDNENEKFSFINELPTINVDDEINSLYNFDIDDLPELNKGDFNHMSIENITIENVPHSSVYDYTNSFDALDNIVDYSLDSNIKENEIDLSELINQSTNPTKLDSFDNIRLIKTTDVIEKTPFSKFQLEKEHETNYENIILVKTTDYVPGIDYSNYKVDSYVQPETVFVNTKHYEIENNNTVNFDYYNSQNENVQPSSIDIESKEVISKFREFPTVEEQIKKIKRPNLFRKYSVASTANLVILKSIDRLLEITQSAVKRNNNSWNK